jgi:hypothetical protein
VIAPTEDFNRVVNADDPSASQAAVEGRIVPMNAEAGCAKAEDLASRFV